MFFTVDIVCLSANCTCVSFLFLSVYENEKIWQKNRRVRDLCRSYWQLLLFNAFACAAVNCTWRQFKLREGKQKKSQYCVLDFMTVCLYAIWRLPMHLFLFLLFSFLFCLVICGCSSVVFWIFRVWKYSVTVWCLNWARRFYWSFQG